MSFEYNFTVDDDIARQNSEFWNELCGSNQARVLGIKDDSPDSLKKFDDWFFGFYPYLTKVLEPAAQPNLRVLEIGLGYGSVASYLLSKGANYTGVDIASGPVGMVNLRGQHLHIKDSVANVGDARDLKDFECDVFDVVVAIGSLHHTGDFDRAIAEAIRVCKPSGVVIGMVYSLFSARNWLFRPIKTFRCAVGNLHAPYARVKADEKLRWMSDHDSSSTAAPATEYFSRRALGHILERHGFATIRSRNVDEIPMLSRVAPRTRTLLIRAGFDRLLGLDLYFSVQPTDVEHSEAPLKLNHENAPR